MKKQQSVLFSITILLLIGVFFLANSIKNRYSSDIQTTQYKKIQKDISDIFDSSYYKALLKIPEYSSDVINTLRIEKKLKENKKDFEYISSNHTIATIYSSSYTKIYNSINDDTFYTPSKHFQYFSLDTTKTLDFEINKFGVTISDITPIIRERLLGFLQLNIEFDTILKDIKKADIEPIVVLNKEYSDQIDPSYSYSRKFIKNRYIINKQSNNYFIKLLEQTDMLNSDLDKFYSQRENIIIVRKKLYSSYLGNFADIYLLKSTDDISVEKIDKATKYIFSTAFLIALLIIFLAYIIYSNTKTKYFAYENERLLAENESLKDLADKLDYNEKKLANLFNLQPNIMFISNGIEIVQVNKRFMGFFRRYGSFEEFKKHHKDIAELFEPCDKPHYISTQQIDGKNWLEYILSNPKQLYKTIMSVNDEKHHFIIKVNEMEYMKNFQERYIVVAFVDITQDLKNKETPQKSMLESQENFDISYTIEENIATTIYELTTIGVAKQAIFKANSEDLENRHLVVQDVEFFTSDISMHWKIILPVPTISYLYNIVISDYDGDIVDTLDDELVDMAHTIIDDFCTNLVDSIQKQENNKLPNIDYLPKEFEIVTQMESENIYKFDIFIEDQNISIFIEFDQNSFEYIKQIQMLGMFFG